MRMVPSRRVAKELIAGGSVRINGRRSPKAAIVGPTDRVEVLAQDAKAPIAAESNAALEVLFEDDSLIVINKPGAIPCHPLRAGEPGTIMNAVVARYPEIASAGDNPLEGGLVHRLDNGTSGALLIVKNSEAFAKLRA